VLVSSKYTWIFFKIIYQSFFRIFYSAENDMFQTFLFIAIFFKRITDLLFSIESVGNTWNPSTYIFSSVET